MYSNYFPNSNNNNFIIKSPVDNNYNCIACAYGTNQCRMWPNKIGFYWPQNVPNAEDINSFIFLFESIGYEKCTDGLYEEGYEKVGLYEKNNLPTHAVRQIDTNWWITKLGIHHDIIHTEEALKDDEYGNITCYLKRKKN
jgi:hypothetical protein